jgi:hypothetical protein
MIKETNSIHKQRGISLFDPSLYIYIYINAVI